MTDWQSVGAASQLADQDRLVVAFDGTDVVLFKVNEQWFGIENRCTHLDFPLDDGFVDEDDATVICMHHGAKFCLKSGKALCAPAFEDVSRFDIKIENGELLLREAD